MVGSFSNFKHIMNKMKPFPFTQVVDCSSKLQIHQFCLIDLPGVQH